MFSISLKVIMLYSIALSNNHDYSAYNLIVRYVLSASIDGKSVYGYRQELLI